MSGESDSSTAYWKRKAEVKVNWVKIVIVAINLIFGVYYFFFTMWLSTLFLFYAIFLPSFFLLFWLSYREKSKEFHDISKAMIAANSDIGRDLIALFENLLVLIYLLLIMFTTIFEGFSFIMLYSPIFIAVLTNFEILGSSIVYVHVIRTWNDRSE